MDEEIWDVDSLISDRNNYALLILNKSLSNVDLPEITNLWNKAALRVCVDGGLEEFNQFIDKEEIELPHVVCGDFDSVSKRLLEEYQEKGVEIIHTPDQNETDFTKALYVVRDQNTKSNVDHVIVIGGVDTCRFDHIIAHINTLHKAKLIINGKVLMIIGKSVIWLFSPGKSKVIVPERIKQNKDINWCSVVPFISSAVISTAGLKWNLNNQECKFGKLISTSNSYDLREAFITINSPQSLLWSMGWSWPEKIPMENSEPT